VRCGEEGGVEGGVNVIEELKESGVCAPQTGMHNLFKAVNQVPQKTTKGKTVTIVDRGKREKNTDFKACKSPKLKRSRKTHDAQKSGGQKKEEIGSFRVSYGRYHPVSVAFATGGEQTS